MIHWYVGCILLLQQVAQGRAAFVSFGVKSTMPEILKLKRTLNGTKFCTFAL